MMHQNHQSQPETGPSSEDDNKKTFWSRTIIKMLLGTLAVVMTLGLSYYWFTKKPRARKSENKQQSAPLVETRTVSQKTHRITVSGMGEVLPSEQIELVSQVSGKITHLHSRLVPGNEVTAGTKLAQIERSDYKIARIQAKQAFKQARFRAQEQKLTIKQAEHDVAEARQRLQEVQAEQDLAKQEYDLLTNKNTTLPDPLNAGSITDEDRKLIMRDYQLQSARAQLKAARASRKKARVAHQNAIAAQKEAKTAVKQAEKDLERTSINAPFDAVIMEKHVGKGTDVSRGEPIADLVRTDTYWIELTLPVKWLQWIQPPATNDGDVISSAQVQFDAGWKQGTSRKGYIKDIRPGIEEQGRMAQVIVEVKDPRSLLPKNKNKPVLLLNTLVDVKINGRQLKNSVRVPRTALREGDQVWTITDKQKLDIRPVKIAARTPNYVYVTDGLDQQNHLVTSDLATPVEGMKIQVASRKKSRKESENEEEKNRKN